MNRAPCPVCGQPVAITRRGKPHRGHNCRPEPQAPPEPPRPPAPDGMAWCGVCGIAVTVLDNGQLNGQLNGHGTHGQACDGSWVVVAES